MKISDRWSTIIRTAFRIWVVWVAVIIQIGFQEDVAAAEKASIFLLENVEIDSPTIHLGKIARIGSPDGQLIRQLNEIVIAKAPLPSRYRIIETGYVQLRLKQNRI